MACTSVGVEAGQDAVVAFQQIQQAVVHHRRRHVGGVTVHRPPHGVGARNISARLRQVDGGEAVPPEAAGHEHHTVGRHRRRNGVEGHPLVLPHETAGVDIVGPDRAGGAGHDLRPAFDLHHQRGGPRGHLVARCSPVLTSRSLVKRNNERVTLVVPERDEPILIQHGRRALAKAHAYTHVAQIRVPQRFPVEVVAVEPA